MVHRIFVVVLLNLVVACSHNRAQSVREQARLLPFEQIHKSIRKSARLAKGERMVSCNSLVFLGRTYPPAGEPDPNADIVIADGPATYFDNATGAEYARCDFWYCSKHSRYCNTHCPPKRWTCDGIAEDPPANTSPERTSER